MAPTTAMVVTATLRKACSRLVASWLTYLPDSPRTFAIKPGTLQRSVQRGAKKANSYVQPSTFDMLAGASPASAMDGWAE